MQMVHNAVRKYWNKKAISAYNISAVHVIYDNVIKFKIFITRIVLLTSPENM